MPFFNALFNKKKKIKDYYNKGAVIVDVRTKTEFMQGAIPNTLNYPLQTLNQHINGIKKLNKPVITCCASGVRSGIASKLLKQNGVDCINGGGWLSLSKKLEF